LIVSREEGAGGCTRGIYSSPEGVSALKRFPDKYTSEIGESGVMRKFLAVVVAILSLSVVFSAQAVDVSLRLGQGGLRHDSAPDGVLGGGQLALDIKLGKHPIAVSISQEHHKKDPVADSPYEIDSLTAANMLYIATVAKKKPEEKPVVYAVGYLGGGIGRLGVPKIRNPDAMERGVVFDVVCGINVNAFWKIGFYIEGKYIYSSKTTDSVKVIDFSDFGGMVGISLNLGW
jgi:hypothetical protein